MTKAFVSGSIGILSVLWLSAVSAADTAAGKRAAQQCVECHNARDWSGEGEASLQSLIKDVVDGKVKHKVKIQLSDADIANIAAYWAAASRNK